MPVELDAKIWSEIVAPFVLGDAANIPEAASIAAKRSLLDLIGVAAAGRTTQASQIAHATALKLWPAGSSAASLIFDGRLVSPAGAAFAGAATIDSMDAHDGYKPAKGHAGVAVLPALLAFVEANGDNIGACDFLAALIVGYEIACGHGAACDL
jgi:2-methylcitrate dehydratase PrpD